jgi:hypothetical protein
VDLLAYLAFDYCWRRPHGLVQLFRRDSAYVYAFFSLFLFLVQGSLVPAVEHGFSSLFVNSFCVCIYNGLSRSCTYTHIHQIVILHYIQLSRFACTDLQAHTHTTHSFTGISRTHVYIYIGLVSCPESCHDSTSVRVLLHVLADLRAQIVVGDQHLVRQHLVGEWRLSSLRVSVI